MVCLQPQAKRSSNREAQPLNPTKLHKRGFRIRTREWHGRETKRKKNTRSIAPGLLGVDRGMCRGCRLVGAYERRYDNRGKGNRRADCICFDRHGNPAKRRFPLHQGRCRSSTVSPAKRGPHRGCAVSDGFQKHPNPGGRQYARLCPRIRVVSQIAGIGFDKPRVRLRASGTGLQSAPEVGPQGGFHLIRRTSSLVFKRRAAPWRPFRTRTYRSNRGARFLFG